MSELEQDSQRPFRTPVVASTFVVVGVTVGAALVVLASLGLLRGRVHDEPDEGDSWRQVPGQVAGLELKAFVTPASVERDRERLRAFGWVDREEKLVHVPIEVAMELYLKQAREQP